MFVHPPPILPPPTFTLTTSIHLQPPVTTQKVAPPLSWGMWAQIYTPQCLMDEWRRHKGGPKECQAHLVCLDDKSWWKMWFVFFIPSFIPSYWLPLHPTPEDLSLPQVILVESMWIHGLHGCSMDSMDFFLAVETPKFSFLSPWTMHIIPWFL